MPIIHQLPPQSAVTAIEEGINYLGRAAERFRDLQVAEFLPYSATVCGLSDLRQGDPISLFALNPSAQEITGRLWRFFVRSPAIPLGLMEVECVSVRPQRFDFLACREGQPVDLAVKAFGAAEATVANSLPQFHLHMVKIPGLCADFFWVQPVALKTKDEILAHSRMIPVFNAAGGIVAGRAYAPNELFEVLQKETDRILNSEFVRTMEGGNETPPPLAMA